MGLKLLILDDEKRITEELAEFLSRKKFMVFEANEVATAEAILKKEKIDVLILDIRLKDANGLDILKKVKSEYQDLEVIMITGHGDMDTVIESMRLGALDFLTKPFKHVDVRIAIERTGKFLRMQQELQQAENRNSLISMELENKIEKDFIGESEPIKNVLAMSLEAAAYKDVNVLVCGESGTGKEIIARIIHFASQRNKYNFFPVNCSAIPDSLLESEFFGHKKGSFTGAIQDKRGFFELTDGGTLFLDEIADMPLPLQAKLLRVIEEKKLKRLGDDKEFMVNIRIVAATNHDLEALIKTGRFRLDLYHRLNTVVIHIPPLRERPSDIEPLLKHFVNRFSRENNRVAPRISPELIADLKNYDFPGNVRELKNLTERGLIICRSGWLDRSCFPVKVSDDLPCQSPELDFNLERNEKKLIEAALQAANHNQTKAAKLLGISRHALIRRLNNLLQAGQR